MDINFSGLVNLHALPTSEPLLPLYEAIVNSIQSIQQRVTRNELDSIKDGLIRIVIDRDSSPALIDNWETDISNISIEDNGIGFNEDNFKSFNTYASDFKKSLGCKGVGRMIWLKAFNNVRIKSSYLQDAVIRQREFEFNEDNAVANVTLTICNTNEISTIVKLIDLKEKNKYNTPKKIQTIARDILNHCFIYFVTDQVPKIIISDKNDTISINQLFVEIGNDNISTENYIVDGCKFNLIHYKNYNPHSNTHKLNLCANARSVTAVNLQNILIGVNSKFTNQKSKFVYNGFITSDYLDQNVNRERTAFNISEEDKTLFGGATKKEIITAASEIVLKYLSEDIDTYNKDKLEIITDFINIKHPRYRILLKYFPECINNILLSDDEEKMELELFKQEQLFKLKLKSEGTELKKSINENVHVADIKKKTGEYAKKLSDLGKSNLAEYIIQRKAVLDLLEENMKYTDYDSEKYMQEESIHQLVFPMRTTSDDIDYSSHNLWLIDEKLSYHYYLASDKKIKSMQPIMSDSSDEPDIMIFDSPFAFTDEIEQPFRNVTIIEFKRPGRKSYNDNENPIQQVIDYMDDIIGGKIKTKDGFIIDGNENIRFYCYILCDITDKIKLYAKQKDFKKTPDGIGFFYYLSNYNAYIEIIPYNKMIQDSKKRNKILFDKLFNQ